jgi:23S rRNA pseudouridine1911/1915/1917 synthase
MTLKIQHKDFVPIEMAFERLDQAAVVLFPEYSRSRLQTWIKSGELLVDGRPGKSKDKVSGGELIEINAILESIADEAEDIPLEIVFEDESVLVINKSAGLVVHPGAGNRQGTLLNALLYHAPDLGKVPRAGIVHRLDKDTTGLMVIAKNLSSQVSLVEQLQTRVVKRVYEGVVYGIPSLRGTVDAAIGRHPVHRTRMAIRESGKQAVTRFRVLHSFTGHSHMEFSLETGRTHQIRVHMQHLGVPLVGDPNYGGSYRTPKIEDEILSSCLRDFNRQALHAMKLSFRHPESNEIVEYCGKLPDDMALLLSRLDAAEAE